ncbi:MAG: L-lactate permease, partial [Bacteroidales bacterium]|nr:L-lactate permease [Bacteroidales bacterium]
MSSLIALIPILLLFILMLFCKMPGYKSALITLAVTVVLALFVAPAMGMVPERFASSNIWGVVGWSLAEGVWKAVFPILIIIMMALYSYNILLKTGQIEVIKAQFTSITDDKGIVVLLLSWGFGGLLEGMAGFGTAVAIPAAILIGLGFKPVFSALVSLIANTVAVAFGAVGVPVTTLCNEVAAGGAASADAIMQTSTYIVIQLGVLFYLIPFIILMITDRKAIWKNLALSLWTGTFSFGVQYVCARFIGAETPAIVGSLAAIVAIILYARLFRKKSSDSAGHGYTAMQLLKAWSVYIFILVFILIGGALIPPVNHFLNTHLVTKAVLPVTGATIVFKWIANAGVMLFLGSTIGGLVQGLSLKQLMVLLAQTVVRNRKTIITIVCLISLSSVMNNSGMINQIALGLVALTGGLYPLFAPLIGAVGTFVTGSDTSANILFGKLQANVAGQLGLGADQSTWLVASNTTGATGGKMISPQSIAIATAACDMEGRDGEILKAALPYAAIYIIISGLFVYFGLGLV